MSWLEALPVLTVAWGVLAIGSVYPWGYLPLAGSAAVSGLIELWIGRRLVRESPIPTLATGLGLLVTAIALQLVPLPLSMVEALSPAARKLLPLYDVSFSAERMHALSINPDATRLGLLLATAFGVFLLGLTVRYTRRRPSTDVAWITALGLLVALTAIVQRGLGTRLVYGLWHPMEETTPYGPFVNRNHFAGWMLMALPLAIAFAVSRMSSRDGGGRRSAWSSESVSRAVLSGFLAIIMAVALVLSASRSGVIAFVGVVGTLGVIAGLRSTGLRRLGTIAYLALLLLGAFWLGTTRTLGARLDSAGEDLPGRVAVWRDAAKLAGDAPWTGTGLNTFGVAMLVYQRTAPTLYYEEAHNDFLQLAAEGGVLVCVPAAILAVIIITAATKRLRRFGFEGARAGAVTGLIAIMVQEGADFSLQIPGNVVLWCVLVAIAVAPWSSPGRSVISSSSRHRVRTEIG